MNAEDLMLIGLAGAVVYLFAHQQPATTVIQAGPTTPQGTSYPSTVPPAPSTSQSTPAGLYPYMGVLLPQSLSSYPVPGARSYIDPATHKSVVCPAGQVVIDVGDLAPSWTCGAPGSGGFAG